MNAQTMKDSINEMYGELLSLNLAVRRDLDNFTDEEKLELFSMPLGAIIATARLVDCLSTYYTQAVPDLQSHEYAFGNYGPDRYMWMLEDVRPLDKPIYCKGALGLWEVPEEFEVI